MKEALRKRKTYDEILEEDRKRFEEKLQAVRDKYEALIKEFEEE
ncbi:hypothetical protein [Sporosarcina koreensis]|uniref:Fur-regulated basic protein B n=1 Tax=Sporosarcina koreensis TaxID=334735 RepID=A0ABW0U299_9BACL